MVILFGFILFKMTSLKSPYPYNRFIASYKHFKIMVLPLFDSPTIIKPCLTTIVSYN